MADARGPSASDMAMQSAMTAEMMSQHQRMQSSSTAASGSGMDRAFSDFFNALDGGILTDRSIMDMFNELIHGNLDDLKSVLDNFDKLAMVKIAGGSQLFNELAIGPTLNVKQSMLDMTIPGFFSQGQGHG